MQNPDYLAYLKSQGRTINNKFVPYRGSDAHKLAGNVLGAEYRSWLGWGFYGSSLLSASVASCCALPGFVGALEAATNLQNQFAVGFGGSLAAIEGAAIVSTIAFAVAGKEMFRERKNMRARSLQLAQALDPNYQKTIGGMLRPNVAVAYRQDNPLPAMELTRREHSRASTATSVGHWALRIGFALGVGGIADVATSVLSVNPLLGQVVGVGSTLLTGFFMASRFGTAGEAAVQLNRTKQAEKQYARQQRRRR